MPANADADIIALASQGRVTRLGKFKSLVDLLLAQLSLQVPVAAGGRTAQGGNKGTAFTNKASLSRPQSVQPGPRSVLRTDSSMHGSQPAYDNGPTCNPPPMGICHMALFGRILGIFPVPITVDRPAITCIATNMLVHLTSPKLNLKRVYDGRPSVFNNAIEPTVREVQPALAEAIYGATTSSVPSAKADSGVGFNMISIKKLVKFLSCLNGGIIDSHWALAPHKVPCVESSAPVPWSEESLSKLLSLLLLRSSPPVTAKSQLPGDGPSLSRRSSHASIGGNPYEMMCIICDYFFIV